MIFEEFVNTIKAINKIVLNEDVRDIESHIGSIENRLKKIAGKNNDNLYLLIRDAIKQIPLGYIVELSEKENLGYKISQAVDLFDNGCEGDLYDCLADNVYVVTNTKGFVKLIEWEDLRKSEQYKHVVNKLAHDYKLILDNPDIPDEYKEPIRKIENLFRVFGVKEK